MSIYVTVEELEKEPRVSMGLLRFFTVLFSFGYSKDYKSAKVRRFASYQSRVHCRDTKTIWV